MGILSSQHVDSPHAAPAFCYRCCDANMPGEGGQHDLGGSMGDANGGKGGKGGMGDMGGQMGNANHQNAAADIAELRAAMPCRAECVTGCDSIKDADKPECKACASCMEKADKPGMPIKMAIDQVKHGAEKRRLGEGMSSQSKIDAASDNIDKMNQGSDEAFDKMVAKMSPQDRARAKNDELFNMMKGQMQGQVNQQKTEGLTPVQKKRLFEQRLAKNMGFDDSAVSDGGYQMPSYN